MNENSEEQKKLIKLIREIVREEINIAFDEHLEDYEHKQKQVSEEAISSE